MSYVGIRCAYDEFDLRRELMLFDHLALPFLEATLNTWTTNDATEEMKRTAADLEWLSNRGVVFIPPTKPLESGLAADDYREYLEKKARVQAYISKLVEFVIANGMNIDSHISMARAITEYERQTGDTELWKSLNEETRHSYDDLSRGLAISLAQVPGMIALPIMSTNGYKMKGEALTRTDVLSISLGAIPFPAQDTSLERLLEFRSDPDVKADFLAFHRWAATTALKSSEPGEIFEEVEYLTAQYQRHMRLHRIEQGVSTFETVVTVAVEALEDLIKFRWSAAAKVLFSFRKRSVALLKAEMDAPGRELAYLVKAGLITE